MSLRFISLLFFSFVTLISSFAFSAEDLGARVDLFKIESIEVVGIKKVEKEAILEKIGSKPPALSSPCPTTQPRRPL